MMKRARSPSPLAMSKKGRTNSPFAPIKIATAEAAAAVQTDPPFLRLLDALRNVTQNPAKGQSVVYWMRMGDLRISDNKALALASSQAVEDRIPLVVLHILSPQDYIAHDRSKTRIDFVLRNLSLVKDELAKLNIPLYTITHTPRKTVPTRVISVLQTLQATQLFANIEYEVDELRRDLEVCSLAKNAGITPTYVHDRCIIEPGVVQTKDGRAYTVYSPYQRRWINILNSNLLHYLNDFPSPKPNPSTTRENPVFGPLFDADVPVSVHGFELDPEENANMAKIWPAGTSSAKETLSRFLYTKARATQLGAVDPLADGAENSNQGSRILLYDEARDRGDKDTTSRLSPYLSAGVISVRECVRATMKLLGIQKVDAGRSSGVGRWVQELAWRDFYTDVLAYYPRVSMGRPFQERFAGVKWEVNEEHLNAWKEGKTGVPIVDATMRQINTMGWTHNRMRMIVAMFLSKDLMLDWRLGERYFMEKLIDGDLASNNGGWQWSSSTGVDAAPYFRLFNPYAQSSKADPTGDFIRTFVPELKSLYGPAFNRRLFTNAEIHNPSAKIADQLGYPRPIVNHAEARVRAIRRYKTPGEE
ncbi:DNA photolyase, FAD-binding/Cryptochrome [Suillus clintonianus]|uniref:DNA photolyase, FAD-binding/Cryptochrome n=1 Tax=Suillus clintonianus TaxID=1904413 RepID=UPI001B860536|nr:DNA photolyase, FAD-binding/Cryptochrome [Suillus clintonianus]KAG2156169.1 DNA photolyase, FAD-binding/Cryptochrome [Suillus clintonianus]